MCGGDWLYETKNYFRKVTSKHEDHFMKREPKIQGQAQLHTEFQANAPDYPTLQSFRKNRNAILKTMGVGAVGLAMSSCQPEPPVLGGVPPQPLMEGSSADKDPSFNVGDGPVKPVEGISLGGVVCPSENIKP